MSDIGHGHLRRLQFHGLVIIGARAFGREVCNYARDMGWTVKGFLDDKVDALKDFTSYPPILGSVEAYVPSPDDVFICALGDPKWREKYVNIIIDKGGRFVNVIHPSAYVGPNVKMGVGCILCPQSVVDCDLALGDHVAVNGFTYVSHDCMAEDFVTISPGCKLGGGTILRRSAFLGIGVTTLPHVEIGHNSYIGAGAVVVSDIPKSSLAVGVPARVVRGV